MGRFVESLHQCPRDRRLAGGHRPRDDIKWRAHFVSFREGSGQFAASPLPRPSPGPARAATRLAQGRTLMEWVILVRSAAVAGYAVYVYNALVKNRQLVAEGWSGIDVQLK